MNDEERAAELLDEIFDSELREKGDKLALAYLSDILQAAKELRLTAVDIETHIDSWKEARMPEEEVREHRLAAYTVEALENKPRDFATSRREAAQALREGCIAIEKEAVAMMESCLTLWPPL